MFTTRPATGKLASRMASIATVVLVAASAALFSAPASAQYRVDVREGQVYRHDGRHDGRHEARREGRGGEADRGRGRESARHHERRGYRHHDRHAAPRHDWRRHSCDPREAIAKARSRGMRHPDIWRMTRGEIVVGGRHRGHRALLVFDRTGRWCRVIAARGI